MSELIQAVLDSEEKSDLRSRLSVVLRHQEKRYLLQSDISMLCRLLTNTRNLKSFTHSLVGRN